MNSDIVARLKLCRANPQMKQADVPMKPSGEHRYIRPEVKNIRGIVIDRAVDKPGFLHTDSGIVFASRSSIKKAIRIVWCKPNPMRQTNKDRFHRALSQIVRANEMSIPEMVKAEITRNVERSSSSGAIQDMLRQMIQTEVAKALGGKASIESKVKAWALEEAKRLVCEGMTLDFRLAGEAYTRPAGSGRPLRLADTPD